MRKVVEAEEGVKKPVYVRLDRHIQHMVEDTNYATSTTTREAPMMLLHPKPARTTMFEAAQICREDSHDAELDTYRLLHAGKTADLYNEAMQGHQLFKPGCEGRLT